MKINIVIGLAFAAAFTSLAHAGPISTNPADYAIVGESTVTLGDGFYSSPVVGDVYSAGTLTVQSGYGIARTPAGNAVSRGDISIGSSSYINGNINANGSVTVGTYAHLNGNVVYGTAYSNPSPLYPVTGTVTQMANSVPAISLPSAAILTSGSNDINTTSVVTLAPGTYGNVSANGLSLSSGDYYLKSFTIPYPNSGNIYLNVTNAPIRVFVQGSVNIGSYLTTYLNGQSSGTSSLASSVLFETGGDFNVNASTLYDFYGTVFAPSGSVSISIGEINGSIMASGPIHAVTYNYLTKVPYNWSNLPVLTMATTGATIITGGTANMAASLTNLVISGGSAANYVLTPTVSSGSLSGAQAFSASGSLAAQASQTFVSPVTSTNIGVNSLTLAATAAGTFSPVQSTTVPLTVLAHAMPTLSTSAASAGRAMANSPNAAASATLSDSAASYRSGLQITSVPLGVTGISVGNVIANGGSKTVSGSLNTSLTGSASTAYSIGVSDDQSLSGAIALPSLAFTVTGTVLDNRRVTAPAMTDIGYVHFGGTAAGVVALSTTGDDNHFTRITVANAAADGNGISISGTNTAFRFGLDGMSSTRTIGGTPNALGNLQGSFNLTTSGETGVTGTQSLASVAVNYTLHVFSGKAAWNSSGGGSWGGNSSWLDYLSASGGAPGVSGFSGDTAMLGTTIGSNSALITLDGRNPVLSALNFDNYQGGSYTLSSGSGGFVTMSTTTGNPAITVYYGVHQITAPMVLAASTAVTVTNPPDVLTISGNVTAAGGLIKYGGGMLTLTGNNSFSVPLVVSGGTLQGSLASLGNSFINNATLALDQNNDATFSGTMSGSGSFVKSGSGMLTLAAADNLTTTGPISVQQGTFAAPLGMPHAGGGIQVSSGGTLAAAQSVVRSVTGNGTVTAIADLFIGQSTHSGQFNQGGAPGVGGTLNVGGNAVVLLSSDAAILGSQTTIGPGGSLTTLNGAQLGNPSSLDATKVLTATGSATVNGNFVNNGVVHGPSAAGQELTFTQFVKGAGSTTGNILYDGSYSPGNSPAAVSVENITFGPNSTLSLEVQGMIAGSQYDQLQISGLATLNGTLNVTLVNGFVPSASETFDFFNGPTTGSFTQINLPALSNGLSWNTSNLYTTGEISVVPEPSTLALFGIGAICLAMYLQPRQSFIPPPKR